MPSHTVRRIATPEERAALEKLLAQAPTAATRVKRGAENALVYWAASMLAIVVIWLAIGWIVGRLFNLNLGLRSSATVWVVAVAVPICAGFAAVSSFRWVRQWSDYRPNLRADLRESQVVEEHYTFTAATRFQEPEHGGLMYFLRASEDEVFTLFDHESQNLGVDGGDPLQSKFRPQSQLLVVRAPRSGFVLSTRGSGSALEVGSPIELAGDHREWPETEALCNIPWSQLHARLGSQTVAASA